MKNEYIIINKTAIQERIEKSKPKNTIQAKEVAVLKQILSQSTPLIPEIEKAFDEGAKKYCDSPFNIVDFISKSKEKDNYISNLKLDI